MTLLFANNATSSLIAPLTSGGTSLTVANGAAFPNPGAGQSFKLTLQDAATQTINEICLCTARSGDTLTVVRGQEGTVAVGWSFGDLASNFPTAGAEASFIQPDQLQAGIYEIPTIGGTVNDYTGTLNCDLTALVAGMKIRFPALGINTGAMSMNLTIGGFATGIWSIVQGNTSYATSATGLSQVMGGVIPWVDYPIELTWDTQGSWILTPIAPQNMMPRAWAIFNAGTLVSSANIATWSKTGTGVYTFTFTNALITANWGINFGSNGTIANAMAAIGASPGTGGGVINGFNTTTGAALDINGCVTFWSP